MPESKISVFRKRRTRAIHRTNGFRISAGAALIAALDEWNPAAGV